MRLAFKETLFLLVFLIVASGLLIYGVFRAADTSAAQVIVLAAVLGVTLTVGLHLRSEARRGERRFAADVRTSRRLDADLQLASQLRGVMGLYLGIAHDLTAPLNAMVLHLELLKRSLENTTAKQRRHIGILEDECRRLRHSVGRLLAQTAPIRAETVRYDLARLVTQVAELLAPQARQQKVELEVDVPRRRLLTVGSPDMTTQALVNVAVNGFEALADGGRLRIEAAAGEGVVTLSVSDDGPGIAPPLRDRIFDLHSTTKENGTGLGLYVTRAMIESQGGSLRIVDTGPAGTTIEMCLPEEGATS